MKKVLAPIYPGHCSFCRGYYDGQLGVACKTTRQVEQAYPEWLTRLEADMYLNAAEDAQRGDTFRMGLHQTSIAQARARVQPVTS